MSRVEENKEVVDHFVKLVDMNMGSGSYGELVTWHLGAISSFLTDISKSLAAIADNMSSKTDSKSISQPKMGKWIKSNRPDGHFYLCSECGRYIEKDARGKLLDYCLCGAKMSKEE